MQNALNSKADANDIPTKTSDLTNDSGFITSSSLPTKVSDLANDSGFITNTVNNLTNYYTKTNTYTKSEVDSLIGSVSSLDIQIVQTLPTQDISTSTIYLVPKTSSTNDNYDEYIYVNNSWEHIGSTEVDLSNYYTKTQTDNLLAAKADANSLSTVATTGDYEDLSNIPVIDYTGSSIRVWNLDDGIYKLTNGCVVYYQGDSNISRTTQGTAYLIVFKKTSSWKDFVLLDSPSYIGYTQASAGAINRIIDDNDVTNNLNQTYEGYVLDARQGKVLNDTKQDLLVSGTNIKTINNQSLLGSGNIDTTGGQSTATDVRINGTTITDDGVANIITESAYNASTNKIATMSDLPPIVEGITTLTGSTINIYDLSNGLYRVPLNCTLYYTSTNYFTASGEDGYLFVNRDYYSLQNYCFIGNDRIITGNTSYNNGSSNESLNNSKIANNLTTTGSGYYVLDAYQGKILKGLIDAIVVPTKTSDLTNDSGFIDGLVILSYGNSTWNDFITAYQKNKVVYCRASSNSNPASGSQTRLAFMAYVNNATSPTEVEFQYYRSVSSHSDSQQGDQVFVYKLTSAGSWTVITRNAFSKVVAGTGLSSSYSNGAITLSANSQTETDPVFSASAASGITSSDITSWNNKSNFSGSYNDLTNKPTLFSGDYDDLTNKPTIPDELADLADDSTHRLVTDTEKSTWNSKQDALVSGTNIKTINGSSILGSGNISITGGASNIENGTGTGSLKQAGNNTASGNYSFASGQQTTASSYGSHAEGAYANASGFYSHAEGYHTTASGQGAHAEGFYTTAKGQAQHVSGQYNVIDNSNKYIEIVGNGTSSANSNAYTLDWSGNGVYSGKLTVGTGPTANMDVATKQYVDTQTSSIVVPTKTSDLTNDSGFVDNTYHDSSKQDTLVSGTNIKTINNQSILGSGNLDILNMVYPVGSIYMSANSTSPATLFGGTWQQIEDTFLLSAGSTYTAGNTGGEATHTLTTDEMPSHTHRAGFRFAAPLGTSTTYDAWMYANNMAAGTVSTDSTGGGQAHNNMPPYLVVYMWERTA